MKPKLLLILAIAIAVTVSGGYWLWMWRMESASRTKAILLVSAPEQAWAEWQTHGEPSEPQSNADPMWQRIILTHAERLRDGGPQLLAESIANPSSSVLSTWWFRQWGGKTAAMAWVGEHLRVEVTAGLATIEVSLPGPPQSPRDGAILLREIVEQYIRDERSTRTGVAAQLSKQLQSEQAQEEAAAANTSEKLNTQLSKAGSGDLFPHERAEIEVLRSEDTEVRRRLRLINERIEDVEASNPLPDVRIVHYPEALLLPSSPQDRKVAMKCASLAAGFLIALVACKLVWRQRRIRTGGFPVLIRSPVERKA
jgi:hypothetical protein